MALQALFEVDCAGHDSVQALDRLIEKSSLPDDTASFARELVSTVLENRERIDALIAAKVIAAPQ